MDSSTPDEHARRLQLEKFHGVLEKLRQFEPISDLTPHKYVHYSSGNHETDASIVSLIHSGNDIVDKCTMVFASLAVEVDVLVHEARSKYFCALLLYGEDADGLLFNEEKIGSSEDENAGIIEMMSNFFPLLFDLSLFIDRCYAVIANILSQLHAFFNLNASDFPSARDRPLTRTWRCLGDCLFIFVTFDNIISAHPMLSDHWKVFAKYMQLAQHNISKFVEPKLVNTDILKKKMNPFLGVISSLSHKLMSANIFENCCQQDYDENILTDRLFLERFQRTIADILAYWERLARDDNPDKQRLSVIVCLMAFYYRIYCRCFAKTSSAPDLIDKKLLKAIFMTHKRISTFHMVGDILWTPLDFLSSKLHADLLGRAVDKKVLIAIEQKKVGLLDKHLETLNKDVEQFQEAVSDWKTELKTLAISTDHKSDNDYSKIGIGNKCLCVLKGARIADKISCLLKYVLNACLVEDRILPKSVAQHIFRLIELISSISSTFNFHYASILEWSMQACMLWSSNLLTMLSSIRSQILSQQPKDTKILDLASTIQIATTALCETKSRRRLIVCVMALEMTNYTKTLRTAEINQIDDYLFRLDSLLNVGLLLSRVTDCSFIFWHRSLAGVYFEFEMFEESLRMENIQLFFDALNQCCISKLLDSACHCQPESLRNFYQRELFALFTEKFLTKLCSEVETDLRLSCHQRQELTAESLELRLFPNKALTSNKSYEQLNTTKLASTLRLVDFLSDSDVFVLRIANRVVNIREYVKEHLEATFYNLTTVALHDNETYMRMRSLARQRYGLENLSLSSHLPFMKVNQGLDIVMIMRNIHIFVENYSYDLNEQMFIERSNKSHALNIISVDQMVNSIKTHGFGILNSSVHYAYQYLKKKLQIFSHFLFDDQIKSLLVKEIHFYRDHIDQLNQMYPLKKAENLNTVICKMGISADGRSLFDRFRELITQIGNTLGVIRMFRTGAIESCAYAAQFIRELDGETNLKDSFTQFGDSFAEIAGNATKVFDELAQTVTSTFDNSEDFIEMLISVFSKEFRNYEKFAHLRNFFIVIPALTLNFTEHIFACQNRLGKRGAAATSMDTDYTFVNDGFSFGVAYMLKLLNQGFFFDSLNWFDSVRTTLTTDCKTAQEAVLRAQKTKLRDGSLIQALAIKADRAEELLNSFQYLEHTLSTAFVFFRVRESVSSAVSNTGGQQHDEEIFLEDF